MSHKRPAEKVLMAEKMATKKRRTYPHGENYQAAPEPEELWMEPKPAYDPLLELPTPNYTYIDENGKIRNPERYYYSKSSSNKRLHPKL
jgi:hypothetical protein